MRCSTSGKSILCLDFDGVIHSYTSGWKGVDIIPDPPVENAFDMIKEYQIEFAVHIFSSRSASLLGRKAMQEWFIKHGWPTTDNGVPEGLEFPLTKPPAHVSIDDRAYTFIGPDNWPSVDVLKEFKPWNK